ILRPAIAALRRLDLVGTEGLAMGFGAVVLPRGAVTDVTVENDQRRAPASVSRRAQRRLDAVQVVCVRDVQHVPPVRAESRHHVLGKGDGGIAFDRDVVVVVDPAQIVEREMAGKRGRLGAHSLHEAPVAANGIDSVIEEIEARPVITGAEIFAGNRHADARGDALTQGTGRGLDPGYEVVLRVPRRLAAPFLKCLMSSSVTAGLPTLSYSAF